MLTPTDKLNIICFVIVTMIAITGIAVVIRMKLPVWKFQVIWTLLMEFIGVILLITRLTNGK